MCSFCEAFLLTRFEIHSSGNILGPLLLDLVVFRSITYHSLFFYSPVDEYLDCFQLGLLQIRLQCTFINKALCVHLFSFLLGKCPGME